MRPPTFVAPPPAPVAAAPVAAPTATVAPSADAAPAATVALGPVARSEQPAGPQRDPVRSIGLAAVFLSAALLSFDTLNRLALAVGWTGSWTVAGLDLRLSWLLPVAIDCYAWLTVREWLRGTSGARRTRYAARSARVALGLTMAANALFHAFEALHWNLSDNAVAAIVVGAIPPFLAERVAVMFTLGGGRSVDANPLRPVHGETQPAQRTVASADRTRNDVSADLRNAVALVVPLIEASAPAVPSQRQVREHLKRHGIRVGFPKVKAIIGDAALVASSRPPG